MRPHWFQSSYAVWLPSAVFSGSSMLAGAATLLLPETSGAPLPDTISDLQKHGGAQRCTAPSMSYYIVPHYNHTGTHTTYMHWSTSGNALRK